MSLWIEEAGDAEAQAWDASLAARELPPSASWAWRSILDDAYGSPTTFLLARNGTGDIVGGHTHTREATNGHVSMSVSRTLVFSVNLPGQALAARLNRP